MSKGEGEYVYLDPVKAKHQYTLIFLHGVGRKGSDMVQYFDEKMGLSLPNFRIVLPSAKKIPITRFGGYDGKKYGTTNWFDIIHFRTVYTHFKDICKQYNQ